MRSKLIFTVLHSCVVVYLLIYLFAWLFIYLLFADVFLLFFLHLSIEWWLHRTRKRIGLLKVSLPVSFSHSLSSLTCLNALSFSLCPLHTHTHNGNAVLRMITRSNNIWSCNASCLSMDSVDESRAVVQRIRPAASMRNDIHVFRLLGLRLLWLRWRWWSRFHEQLFFTAKVQSLKNSFPPLNTMKLPSNITNHYASCVGFMN